MRMELPPNPSQLFIFSFSTQRCSQLTKHYCTGWVGNGLLGLCCVFVPGEDGMAFFLLSVFLSEGKKKNPTVQFKKWYSFRKALDESVNFSILAKE